MPPALPVRRPSLDSLMEEVFACRPYAWARFTAAIGLFGLVGGVIGWLSYEDDQPIDHPYALVGPNL